MIRDTTLGSKLWAAAIWFLVGFFVINLFAMIATVVTSSFATRWLGTWLPVGFTTRWYSSAWSEFQLWDVLVVTFQVIAAVVFISGALGITAAYALARRDFPGKRLLVLLFLLPLSFRRSRSASRSRPCFTRRVSPAPSGAWWRPISCRPFPS